MLPLAFVHTLAGLNCILNLIWLIRCLLSAEFVEHSIYFEFTVFNRRDVRIPSLHFNCVQRTACSRETEHCLAINKSLKSDCKQKKGHLWRILLIHNGKCVRSYVPSALIAAMAWHLQNGHWVGAQKWFRKCKYMNYNGEISWATSWMENKHEMHPLLVTHCHVKKENEKQNAYTFQPLCGCCASMRFISFSQICSSMAGSLSLVGLLWLVS